MNADASLVTCAMVLALSAAAFGAAAAGKHTLAAAAAFEEGMGAWGVRLRDADRCVVLYDRNLVEDDGPGIGGYAPWMKAGQAPTTGVAGDVWVRKVLHVDRPEALEARLYWGGRGLAVRVNGTDIEAASSARYPKVPVSLLRRGDNEIVLHRAGGRPRKVKIARREDILRNAPDRKDRPARSFVSRDGGKTYQPVEGEHMVRLHLIQYAAEGHLISPAIDLASAGGGAAVLPAPVAVESVAAEADADTPKGTAVKLALRTGPSPVYDESLWSAWKPARTSVPASHRYVQFKAALSSADPTRTPALRSVTVAAKLTRKPAPAWWRKLRVTDSHNERIRYTSIPFVYEDPGHPKMVALRKKYKLDEVVAGATGELARLVKLRNWVARQWTFAPPARDYPAWDADEILTGKYGFCVQYAVVFMQCAISLGHQTRFVFGNHPGAIDGGGHEVCEFWSNEHGKWVFFDINQSWHHVDRKTGVPLNLLEIHDLIVRHYYGGGFADPRKAPRKARYTDGLATCYLDSLTPNTHPDESKAWHRKAGRYRVPSRWLYLRYMPRNNYLSRPQPVPKQQGIHWDYSDYVIWQDAQTPDQFLYRHFTARRSDLDWTINQVRFGAAPGRRAGEVRIRMGTVTPHLDTYLVNVDGGGWKPSGPTVRWHLRPGRNRIEMRVRNSAGVVGPVSFLAVGYDG